MPDNDAVPCMSNCQDWPKPCPDCGCECHKSPLPPDALLSDEQIGLIAGQGMIANSVNTEMGLHRWMTNAASKHTWEYLMRGIPVENLTAETQYAAAWGRHSRDAEVARLRAERDALVEAFKLESDALFDVINGVRKELTSKDWMLEGRGPYQWDDDEYREEAKRAFDLIRDVVEQAVQPGRERYDAAIAAVGKPDA